LKLPKGKVKFIHPLYLTLHIISVAARNHEVLFGTRVFVGISEDNTIDRVRLLMIEKNTLRF
jgi:hypothetical protein